MVGNKPNYNSMDIIRALLNLKERVSRSELVKKLELGEGTIRSILDILKEKGLLSSTRKGHSLTEKGQDVVNKIQTHIFDIKQLKTHLTYPTEKKAGLLLRNEKLPRSTVNLRDKAVKSGASGALIFTFKKGLKFPDTKYKMETQYLEDSFEFKEGDILIVCFADSFRESENGCLQIAFDISKGLNMEYIA